LVHPQRDALGDAGCLSSGVEAVKYGYQRTRRSKKAD
jgi:hypothetical protein